MVDGGKEKKFAIATVHVVSTGRAWARPFGLVPPVLPTFSPHGVWNLE